MSAAQHRKQKEKKKNSDSRPNQIFHHQNFSFFFEKSFIQTYIHRTKMTDIKTKKRKNVPSSEDSQTQKRRRNNANTNIVTSMSSTTNPKDENGLSECFHKVSTHLYVSLAPIYTHEPLQGIKTQHLDPLLMSYFAPAGGVILAHYNVKLCGQDEDEESQDKPVVAKIMYDSPFAYMWISVDLLVWKPMPGDLLEGWINLQSPSHIGLLVHDTFNVTIKRDAIPKTWTFVPNQADDETMINENEEENDETNNTNNGTNTTNNNNNHNNHTDPKSLGYWIDDSGERIDGKIKFTVKLLNVSSRIVSVQGSLLKPGEIREDLTKLTTTGTHDVASKKRVKFENNDESSESSDEKTQATSNNEEEPDTNNNNNDDDGKVEYGESDSDSD